jgi:hypothetical protein
MVVSGENGSPSFEAVAKQLGVRPEAIDRDIGVVPVDPKRHPIIAGAQALGGESVADRMINYAATSFSFFPFVFALTKAVWSMSVCVA